MNAAVSEVPNAVSFEAFTHRRSQGGQRGHALYKLLAYLAVLCFKRRRPKANSGARWKSKYLAPPKVLVWLRYCL